MPSIRSFRSISPTVISLAVLSAAMLLSPAFAAPPIEQQMSPEQFRSAGLDKLSPEELANLNRWLGNTLETETAKAAELARTKVEDENRGFLDFGREDPIVSRIQGRFAGFARGRSWTLENGQVWEQIDTTTLTGVRVDAPQVKITPSFVGSAWYMAIDGYNTRAKVKRVK